MIKYIVTYYNTHINVTAATVEFERNFVVLRDQNGHVVSAYPSENVTFVGKDTSGP